MAFLAFLAVVSVPFWSVTLALAPLPIYLTTKRRGPIAGVIMLVGVGAAGWAVIGWAAIPAALVISAVGYLPGLVGPSGRPWRRVTAAALFLFTVFSALGALAYLADRSQTAKVIARESTTLREQVLNQAGGRENMPGLEAELDRLLAVMPYLLAATAALASLWLAWLNYFLTGRLSDRWGISWQALPVFPRWQMPWYAAYGFILGLIGVLFSEHFDPYGLQAYGSGLGFLLVFGSLYFIQGLAIIKFYVDKYNLGPAAKVGALVAGVLVQMVFQGLSWLGLFDTWFDFRRLASSG